MRQRKRRKSERQYIWQYLRRNRVCSVEDILTIFDLKKGSLQKFFKELEQGGYIVAQKIRGKVPHKFEERNYILVKNSGALVPRYILKQSIFYDPNTQETIFKDKKMESETRGTRAYKYRMGQVIKVLRDINNATATYFAEVMHTDIERVEKMLERWIELNVVVEIGNRYYLNVELSDLDKRIYKEVDFE